MNASAAASRGTQQNLLAQQRASAKGQYPAAVILSCIDSRAPAEAIMDLGIGDVFNARVAGNIANDDILGSMEFACAAGRRQGGAGDGTHSVRRDQGRDRRRSARQPHGPARQDPAGGESDGSYQGDRSAKNNAFVDAVARRNVELTMENIRKGSSVLSELKAKGAINVVGAMYDIASGKVDFFS